MYKEAFHYWISGQLKPREVQLFLEKKHTHTDILGDPLNTFNIGQFLGWLINYLL